MNDPQALFELLLQICTYFLVGKGSEVLILRFYMLFYVRIITGPIHHVVFPLSWANL